jgi:hypothetical protein
VALEYSGLAGFPPMDSGSSVIGRTVCCHLDTRQGGYGNESAAAAARSAGG